MAGLAQVVTGWTGSVSIVIGSVTSTVTPDERDSVVRVVLQLAADTAKGTGSSVQAWSDASGQLRIYSSLGTWRLVSSGTTKDRLVSPASDIFNAGETWQAATPHLDGYYPARGLAVRGAPVAFTTSSASSEGAYSGANVLGSSSVTFTGYDEITAQWADELTLSEGSVWDYWRDGFFVFRSRLGMTTRSRWGALGSEARIRAQADLVRGGFG